MLTCDQAQQITSLLPQNGIPLAESFPVQTNIHWNQDPLHGDHVSMNKNAHCLSPFVPSKTLCLPKSQGDLLCQGQQIDPSDVRILKTSISWPLPLSGLLMGWRSRWCWQTRMQSQARWCQWCKCRDSCRQGHPHRRLAPPSARPVPAKTASTGCFLQQDWEWCPQNKASPSRQGPRARKRAHVRRSEPCCKFCHTESCTGAAFKEVKLKPKSSRSPMWIQTR